MSADEMRTFLQAKRAEALSLSIQMNTPLISVGVGSNFTFNEFADIKDIIIRSGVSIEHHITKLSIGFTNEMDSESLMTIFSLILQPLDALYKAIQVAKECKLCKIFQDTITGYGKQVEISIDQYINTMIQCCYDETFKIPPTCTGVVWDACRNLKNIADSNSYCVRKFILQHIKVLSDIITEFKDISEGECVCWDDVDEDEGNETINKDDITRLNNALILLQSIGKLLTQLSKMLKCIPMDMDIDQIKSLDEFVCLCNSLREFIDEYSCELYPPHDTDALFPHTLKIKDTLIQMSNATLNLNFIETEVKEQISSSLIQIQNQIETFLSMCECN